MKTAATKEATPTTPTNPPTATPPATLAMRPALDREIAWYQGGSVRYLLAEIAAPPAPEQKSRKRPHLNLALVIDRSGSMNGLPLAAAKRAAEGVVATLQEGDLLSLVAFDSTVDVHLDATKMDAVGKASAFDSIRSIEPRGSTDLAAGWLTGAECVARAMERHSDSQTDLQSRVIILSDGCANQGIVDPMELATHASELAGRGLYSSTVGIGDHYSTEQIQTIAEHGGGSMHDAETPEEIVEVVSAELLDLQRTAAEDLRLEIEVPAGVRVKSVNDFPTQVEKGRVVTSLGSILFGASRQAAFKLKLPAGRPGDILTVALKLTHRIPGSSERRSSNLQTLRLTLAEGKVNNPQPKDERVAQAVTELWQAQIVHKVTGLNRSRDYRKAHHYLTHQLGYFERYCQDVPGAERLVNELQQLLRQVTRPWSERSRKEIELASYKKQYAMADHRSAQRGHWSEFVGK